MDNPLHLPPPTPFAYPLPQLLPSPPRISESLRLRRRCHLQHSEAGPHPLVPPLVPLANPGLRSALVRMAPWRPCARMSAA